MEEQIHRISHLPDELLIRILSFVPVEEIARAKLVSKPWQKLSELSFLPPLTFESPRRSSSLPEDIDIPSFINAVDSSLKLHEKDLSHAGLHLRLDLYYIQSQLIGRWIAAALERKVALLDLCFLPYHRSDPYPLPVKVFGTGTVTVLRLEGCRLEITGGIDLPALRKLYLGLIHREEQAIQKPIHFNISHCMGF